MWSAPAPGNIISQMRVEFYCFRPVLGDMGGKDRHGSFPPEEGRDAKNKETKIITTDLGQCYKGNVE